MALPDVQVFVSTAASARTLPTDTGQAFAVGVTQRGSSLGPQLCRSLVDFVTYAGARLTTSTMYDWADHFFAEGGTSLWISRVFGAGAASATKNLMDSGAGVSLVVTAGAGNPSGQGNAATPDPGTWANGAAGGLKIAVLAATGGYQLQVLLNDVIVETSPVLVTQADAIAWSATSNYVDVALGATALVPVPTVASSLAGGTDGSAVADADFQAALDRIPPELGPGQVALPGQTTAARQLMALAHCNVNVNDRFAQLDAPDTSSASTLVSAAQALYSAPNSGRRFGQLFAPWDVITGLTSGSTRTVPPSARACAAAAKVDALGNPNLAPAGKDGFAVNTLDLSQPAWSATDRLALNNAGVTISRRRYQGAIAIWGVRTLADQTNDVTWSFAPNVRCTMACVAQFKAIGDQHEFDQIDGFGHSLSGLQGDIIGACLPFFSVGALYGATPAEAFKVDVGPGVNPPAQLQQGIMTAAVALRFSPPAEVVRVNVVRVPISQAL